MLTFQALVFKLFTVANLCFQLIFIVDNTKLPCYTLPLTQHHSFFRNLPPLFTFSRTLLNSNNILFLEIWCDRHLLIFFK